MENNEDKIKFANRLPSVEDKCQNCYNQLKRRLSTEIPSTNKCNWCGLNVYEIHLACLDCAEKEDACPWCLKTPWIKYNK